VRVLFLSIGRFRGKAVMVLLVLCLFIFFLSLGVRNYYEGIISMELISFDYTGKVSISQKEHLRAIQKQLKEAEVVRGNGVSGSYKLVLVSRNGSSTFVFRDPGRLVNIRTGNIYLLKDRGKCLELDLNKLESQNPYGEFLTWEQAKDIFCKYDKARIIDFDTGTSFMVQRRAGSLHADVQPMTAADSAVMKTIYGGKWSWRRRAILVEVRGHRIAASMNGMPHGAGAIANNDFSGHFCIHFRDSKTHSKDENLAHQIMVWKAAGKFMEQLNGAKPEQIARVMLAAVEQSDLNLASKLVLSSSDSPEAKIREQLSEIRWLVVSEISRPELEGSMGTVNLTASYKLADGTRYRNRKITLILKEDQKSMEWRVAPLSLERFLSKQAAAEGAK